MDDKLPLWKPVLILVVLALCTLMLYPPSRTLKPGLDLAGGTTLVYQVDVPDGMPAKTAVEQVIASLKKRVDPQGIRNLIWRPLAGNRFEIQMALATQEIKTLRKKYMDLLEAMARHNLNQRQLKRILQLPAPDRQKQLQNLAADNATLHQNLMALAKAYDLLEEARQPEQAAEKALRQAEKALAQLKDNAPQAKRKQLEAQKLELINQMLELERLRRKAQQVYDNAMNLALANTVPPAELQEILNLPNTVKNLTKSEKAKIKGTPLSPRAKALNKLKARAVARAREIDEVAAAYAAYEKVKGPLDDPADLITLLQGSGVLEFRIAAPPDLPDAQAYRDQLKEKGPRAGANKPYIWLICDRDENGQISFAETAAQRKRLEQDPVAYFAGHNLLGQAYNGEYYLLLANTPDASITQAQTGWELTRSFPDRDNNGFPAVAFRLNNIGGALMGELTSNHLKEPMAICLDGKIISAPYINSRIRDSGIITGGSGGFSATEMNYLVRTLNAGALQARVSEKPLSIKTTGPQLGQDNLHAGLEASVLALIVVAIFMLIYYFFSGFVAVLALGANMIVILGVMAMIRATFTLPGIAGIVLTIGMAVDANVLIIERIREELQAGEKLLIAVRRGYDKAFSTIVDANLTTLITCVVLYHTATAEIKGFALVLGIGIVSTLFTALFCTRIVMELWIQWFHPTSLPLLPNVVPMVRRMLHPNVKWVQKRNFFTTISVIFMILGIAVTWHRGRDILDIEFRSGTEVSFDLKKGTTLSLTEVRQRLTEEAKKSNLPQLAGDQARVVTVGEAQAHTASAFSIQTLIADSTRVSRAIKEAFADVLDQDQPLSFTGMDIKQFGQAPISIINQARLGDNINRPIDDDVSAFIGGVAIVLDHIEPAVSEKELTTRIKRMRLQPAYEKLGYRDFEVIGMDLAPNNSDEPLYRSAVVVTRDVTTNYVDNPTSFAENPTGLAATEWNLVRDALTRDTTLGSVSSFSSQVSDTMKSQAIQAMVLSLLAVIIYIWLRFGKITYGLAAIAALVHDVTITLGLLAASYYVFDTAFGSMLLLSDFKINLAAVAALLTIVGYSLNDTIVVFDRIRENRGRLAEASEGIIDDSINQTISRTVITSVTTLLAVLILYIVGGDGVHGFAFAMLIGVFVGTYSSVAIAAPILLIGRKAIHKTVEKSVSTS